MANWKKSIVSHPPTLSKHTLTLTPRKETATSPDKLAVFNSHMAAHFHPEDKYVDLKTLKADIVAKLDYVAKRRRRDENDDETPIDSTSAPQLPSGTVTEAMSFTQSTKDLDPLMRQLIVRPYSPKPHSPLHAQPSLIACIPLIFHPQPSTPNPAPSTSTLHLLSPNQSARKFAGMALSATKPHVQVVQVPATPVIAHIQRRQAGNSLIMVQPVGLGVMNNEQPLQTMSRKTCRATPAPGEEVPSRMTTRSTAKESSAHGAATSGASAVAVVGKRAKASANEHTARQIPPSRITAASVYGVSRRQHDAARETQGENHPTPSFHTTLQYIPLMSAPKRRLAPASRQTQSAPKRPTTARTFDIHAIPTPRPSTNKGDRVDAPLMEPRTPHKRVAAPQPGRPTKSGNRVNCFDTRQEKPSSGRTEVQYIDD
ncbi:hypothetical protein SNOG_10159 [Parastagonospora nodorum SN15]|uniref:Uncharacterized protein n=1 Tax=Phaeosphaeria nodorum (strain SN15 / ATCC MYA-4574 / FGSC 10173) TaxID=321614 RepID=Q0UDK5_PHANO|nr:hypothetical protein SNOG_10159 [Parastagonospora nodorum SN15]EAT82494.1 hypothetical protein SNOG_10159 [Parastagonospora nodorum SN15]